MQVFRVSAEFTKKNALGFRRLQACKVPFQKFLPGNISCAVQVDFGHWANKVETLALRTLCTLCCDPPYSPPPTPRRCFLRVVPTCTSTRLQTCPDGAAAAAPPQQMWLPQCRTPFREQCYWFRNNGPFIFHLFFSFQRLAFSYYCSRGPVSKPAQYL